MNIDGKYLILMCIFYFITIGIEMPILIAGLSRRHPVRHRVFAGIWLTACSYPIVWLVFPALIDMNRHRTLYLVIAETFAPAAECLLFWIAFVRAQPPSRPACWRDMGAIVAANLASFGIGMLLLSVTDPTRWL